MIKYIFMLLVVLLMSCTEKKEVGFSIKGELENLANGEAFLVKLNLDDNSTQYVDTAKIINGSFEFSGKVNHPYPYTIYLNSTNEKIHLFLDNSDIHIKGSFHNLDKIEVSGSREDSLFRPWFNSTMFEFKPDLDIIFNKSDYYLAPFIAFYHVQSYPTSLDSMHLMLNQFKGDITKSEYYKSFNRLVTQSARVAIGQAAPQFTLPDTLGNLVALQNIEAKLILIDFWASWCKPCRAANPILVELYSKYHGKGLEIISISVDDNREKWKKAINKDGLTWTQLSEVKGWKTKVTNDYAIKAVPQSYLLDSNKVIIKKNIEPCNLQIEIDSYFNSK